MYDYAKRAYEVDPVVGQRVRHTELDKFGTIAREDPSMAQYVMVKIDGLKHVSPCHPNALEYGVQQSTKSGGGAKEYWLVQVADVVSITTM